MAWDKRLIQLLLGVLVLLLLIGGVVFWLRVVDKDDEKTRERLEVMTGEIGERERVRMEKVMREDPESKEIPIIVNELSDDVKMYATVQLALMEVVQVNERVFEPVGGGERGILLDLTFEFEGVDKTLRLPIVGPINAVYGGADQSVDASNLEIQPGDIVDIQLMYVPDQFISKSDVLNVCKKYSDQICLYYLENTNFGSSPIDFYEYYYSLIEETVPELSFDQTIPIRIQNLGPR